MGALFEVKILRDEVNRGHPDTYSYELGHFIDGLLEGPGRRETSENGKGKSEFGLFHEGLLNGPGVIEDTVKGTAVLGYFKMGELVNPDQLRGFEVQPVDDIIVEGNGKYLVSGAKRYTKETDDGLIEMTLGTFSHSVVHFISGPRNQPLKYPWPYALLKLKQGDNEIFSIETAISDMGRNFVKIKTADDFCERTTAYDLAERVCPFRKYHFVDVRAKATESIESVIYSGPYSVRFHIPRSVKRIRPDAVAEAKGFLRYVEVFYEGTKEEWENIVKEANISETVEDYYGWTHHGAPRYSTYTVHRVFPLMCTLLAVHCLDGDIKGE